MKMIKHTLAALTLSTIAFGAFAAQPLSSVQGNNLHEVGVISVDNATTLDSLESKLSQKADEVGAKAYSITSANTRGKMNATAVIYK